MCCEAGATSGRSHSIYFTTCHPASRVCHSGLTFQFYFPTCVPFVRIGCVNFVSVCFRAFYVLKDLNGLLRTLPQICHVLSCCSKLKTIVCASSLQDWAFFKNFLWIHHVLSTSCFITNLIHRPLTPTFHFFSFFPSFAPFLLIRRKHTDELL